MISSIRKAFNADFSEEKYQEFLSRLTREFNYTIPFRVAESPIFIPRALSDRIREATESIVDVLVRPDFKALSESAIPDAVRVPNETDKTLFLAIDFAVCRDEAGELTPQLIELQGCPSLYYYQPWLADRFREMYPAIPDSYSHFLGGMDNDSYYKLLEKEILAGHNPDEVILLEIDPPRQNTYIDFLCTQAKIGVRPVCISDVQRDGDNLFYRRGSKNVPIKRIYNRLIFDEYLQRPDIRGEWEPTEEANVEWAGHPNWFFRISKHTMPRLKSPYVPETSFLNELKEIPADLENYVLKPLFSFSGSGVVFNVTQADIDAVKQPHEYILQRKVSYAPVIDTPDIPAKCEIRILYVWPPEAARPIPVINLVRLSKGVMIGVKYNMEKKWVGGAVGFFEP